MLQRPGRLFDLALRGLLVTFLACAAVLVAILVVDVLQGGELGPVFQARQAEGPSASAPQQLR